MSTSMVSRRVVGFTKGKRKSSAPPPQSSGSGELVGEKARQFAPMMARVAPIPAPGIWSQKSLLKGLAMLVGALVCAGLAYFVFNGRSDSSRGAPTRTESFSSAPSPVEHASRRPGRPTATAGGKEVPKNIEGADRLTPTDNSFLATAYVRKKVSLPNISGVCVVKANGSIDVAECLRRQE